MLKEEMISGPAGRIEARYHYTNRRNAPVALVLHPHPERGGTMNSKVSYTLFQTFVNLGFNVLRFNFRGVGRSEGTFGQGEGELSDAAACLDWLQAHNPDPQCCWVAGFSFGAWVAMQLLMRRPEFSGFIAVSPPANMYDFGFLAPCPNSGLILQGAQDTLVPLDSVENLAQRLALQRGIQVDLKVLDSAEHFFKNELPELSNLVKTYVETRLELGQQAQVSFPLRKTAHR